MKDGIESYFTVYFALLKHILCDCIKTLQNKNTNQVMQILESKQHITDHTIQLSESSSLQIHSGLTNKQNHTRIKEAGNMHSSTFISLTKEKEKITITFLFGMYT